MLDNSIDHYFIMGPHRSGTTILGKWLQETGAFNTLTLENLVTYLRDEDTFSIAAHGGQQNLENLIELLEDENNDLDRGFDPIKVNKRTFEEYAHLIADEPPDFSEFKLVQSTKWLRFMNPVAYFKLLKHINPADVHTLNSENIGRFNKMSELLAEKNKELPQLHKNPFDFLNPLVYDEEHIPNAKHIVLFRDPAAIVNSTIDNLRDHYNINEINPYFSGVNRFYRETFENEAYKHVVLSSMRGPFGPLILYIRLASQLREFRKRLKSLDKNSYVPITYEFLCDNDDNRDATIDHILREFDLTRKSKEPLKPDTNRRNKKLKWNVWIYKPLFRLLMHGYYSDMRQVNKKLKDYMSEVS